MQPKGATPKPPTRFVRGLNASDEAMETAGALSHQKFPWDGCFVHAGLTLDDPSLGVNLGNLARPAFLPTAYGTYRTRLGGIAAMGAKRLMFMLLEIF